MKQQLDSPDDRSPMAKAIDQAAEVFTACLMMVLPGVGGYFLDKSLKTLVLFTLLGFLFGSVAATWQIIKLVKRPTQGQAPGVDAGSRLDVESPNTHGSKPQEDSR